jgi:diguanylate cyclase
VRQNVEALRISVAPALRVTVSIGANLIGVGQPIAEALQRADQALYVAKTAGRNRVVLACELSTAPRQQAA